MLPLLKFNAEGLIMADLVTQIVNVACEETKIGCMTLSLKPNFAVENAKHVCFQIIGASSTCRWRLQITKIK